MPANRSLRLATIVAARHPLPARSFARSSSDTLAHVCLTGVSRSRNCASLSHNTCAAPDSALLRPRGFVG